MSAGTSREAFEAWHADRKSKIAADIEALAARWISEGSADTPVLHKSALLYVLSEQDEIGWDVWQASRKQALAEVAALFPDISAGYRSTTIKQAIEELK